MAEVTRAMAVASPPPPPKNWDDIANRVREFAASRPPDDWRWLEVTRAYLAELAGAYLATWPGEP